MRESNSFFMVVAAAPPELFLCPPSPLRRDDGSWPISRAENTPGILYAVDYPSRCNISPTGAELYERGIIFCLFEYLGVPS